MDSLRANASLSKEQVVQIARSKKEELMGDIWTIMTTTLGVPLRPDERFTWDYYTKDGKPRTWTGTPVQFYKAFSSKQYPVRTSWLRRVDQPI